MFCLFLARNSLNLLQTLKQWRLKVALHFFWMGGGGGISLLPLWRVRNTMSLIELINTLTYDVNGNFYSQEMSGYSHWTCIYIMNKQCDGLLMVPLCLLNRLKTRKNRRNFSSRSVLRWTCFLNNTANIESFPSCWMLMSMDQLVLLSWDHCSK